MSCLIQNRRPHPLSFGHTYTARWSRVLNLARGNESSSFVSEKRKMLTFLSCIYTKESSLVLIELMPAWPKISLSGEWIFISFSPVLASKKQWQILTVLWYYADCSGIMNHICAVCKIYRIKLLWKLEFWHKNWLTFSEKPLAYFPEFVR